jgi:hypothetical protein
VNFASAISDLMDDEQTEMIRAMIGCVVMATKSKRPDDLTISSKILSKIAVEKVQEAVVKELVKRGGRLVSKSGQSADKDKGATEQSKANQPDVPAPHKPSAPSDPTQGVKQASTPDTPSTTGRSGSKPLTQQETADAVRLAQQQPTPEAKPQRQGRRERDDPAIADKGTSTKPEETQSRPRYQHQQQQTKRPNPGDTATTDKATEAKATDAKAAGDTDVDSRATRPKDTGDRGTKPSAPAAPKEPPVPPSNMPWRDRWKFYDKHRNEYPPHIQQMLDRIEKRTKTQHEEVDAAIREHHAQQLSQYWGIPVKTTERIPKKGRAKKRRAAIGRRPIYLPGPANARI